MNPDAVFLSRMASRSAEEQKIERERTAKLHAKAVERRRKAKDQRKRSKARR